MTLHRTLLLIALFALAALMAAFGCDTLTGGTGTAEVAWTVPTEPDQLDLVQPIVEDGRAYVAYEHYLRAFDADDGRLLWSTDLGNGTRSLSSRKLLSEGDVLYLEHTDWVKAFEKESGRLLWQAGFGDFVKVALSKMDQDEAYLYLGGRGAALQIRKSDGAIVRRFEVGTSAPEDVTELVYDVGISSDGLLYLPVGYSVPGDAVAIRGAVYCFDTQTGEQRWAFEVPVRRFHVPGVADSLWADGGASGAVVWEDRVLVTTTSQVFALDRFTGAVLWERFFAADGGFWVGPTVANGALYAGGVSRYVYKLDVTTGQALWHYFVEGSLTPIIVVRDGRVYFTDDAWGELWVLDDETGEPIWHGPPPEHDETGEGYISPVGVGERYMVSVAESHIYGLTKP